MPKAAWDEFCERAAQVMRDALAGKTTLEQASEFFESDRSISDPNLRRYIEYLVWEIDGSRDHYERLLELLEERATEDELVQYLNSGKSPFEKLADFLRNGIRRNPD